MMRQHLGESNKQKCPAVGSKQFLSARKADLKKGFQHLVVVLLLLVVVVGTRVKKRF
jgi:hypothetical protein